MTLRTLFVALVLTAIPALAIASEYGCSARGHQAQSCAPGTVWDAGLQTCVKQVNS